MAEKNIDKILAQQVVFNAWMAELPEPTRMTHDEIYQMIRDKVGHADPDTMTEWIYRLKERLGVVVDHDDEEKDEKKVVRPYIYYRWWQQFVSDPELTVHIGDIQLELKDDGSHKWRYMTNLQDKKDWEFILRNMDEDAELRLIDGSLQLQTATVSTQVSLSEDDCKALSESVRELMTRHPKGMSAPQERQIHGKFFPQSYMVTEQIYSSPFLHLDGDDEDGDDDDGDDAGDISSFIKKRD